MFFIEKNESLNPLEFFAHERIFGRRKGPAFSDLLNAWNKDSPVFRVSVPNKEI